MNKILLTGRLTKEPELRYTKNTNIEVCQFSLAVTRNFKNSEGVYEADFITCIAYRKTAEMMKNYLHKGDKIGIEGRLQTRSYDDKDGNKKYVSEVIVEHLEFLESRKDEPKAEETAKVESDPFQEFGEENETELSKFELPW